MTGRIKHILFNLDGTLVESSRGILESVQYTFSHFGLEIPPEEEVKKAIGINLSDSFRFLIPDISEENLESFMRVYREHYYIFGLYECDLFPGVYEMLNTLSDKYCLYIVTSKPKVFAEKVTVFFGISKMFVSVKGAEFEGYRKSKSRIVKELFESHGLASDNTVMVGDRCEDVFAAKENGLASIAVLHGYGSEKDLISAGVDIVVADIFELNELLCAEPLDCRLNIGDKLAAQPHLGIQ